MDMKALTGRVAGVLLAVWLSPALAHHSFASFNMKALVDVKGTVKEFHYTNPHTWIVLESQDASGKPIEVTVEANGPGYLVRTGWKRTTLMPGDVVTLTIHPMHDGSPGGSLVKVTFADGHELIAH